MLKRWRLLEYVSPVGERGAIDDWRKSMIGNPRLDLNEFLKLMSKSEKWEYPDIDTLKGYRYREQKLTELRWRSDGRPHRIFGYQSGDFEYTMLIGCTHNAKKYDPPDAMETARKRKIKIDKGEALTREFKLLTDE